MTNAPAGAEARFRAVLSSSKGGRNLYPNADSEAVNRAVDKYQRSRRRMMKQMVCGVS